MYLRDRLHSLYQAFVDSKGTYGRGNVAAVHGLAHDGSGDIHLAKVIVYINAGAGTFLDDGDLAGGGIGAAHAVNLAAVRRTKGAQNYLIALLHILRKVFVMEKHGLGRAASHIDAGNFHIGFVFRHGCVPPYGLLSKTGMTILCALCYNKE